MVSLVYRLDKYKQDKEERLIDRVIGKIFEHSPVGNAVVDLQGRWVKVNQALCNYLGYEEWELKEQTFLSVTHPEDIHICINNVKRMLAKEITSYQVEKRYIKKTGEIVYSMLSAFLLRKEETEEPLFYVATIQDITEKKEREKLEIERLEKQSTVKSEFISTASHELRNPLTNIKMAVQFLKNCNREDSTKYDRYVNILENECNREIKLVNDLLDLQRLEMGCGLLEEKQEVHLDHWLSGIMLPFVEQANEKGLVISYTIISGTGGSRYKKVYLNSTNRIISELLTNAIKYTLEGGMINVTLKVNNKIEIEISNTGSLTEEEIDNMFKRFYRLSNSKKIAGTGLGLPLVKELVEQLEGRIEVNVLENRISMKVELPI